VIGRSSCPSPTRLDTLLPPLLEDGANAANCAAAATVIPHPPSLVMYIYSKGCAAHRWMISQDLAPVCVCPHFPQAQASSIFGQATPVQTKEVLPTQSTAPHLIPKPVSRFLAWLYPGQIMTKEEKSSCLPSPPLGE
jgi:hypothetical protein